MNGMGGETTHIRVAFLGPASSFTHQAVLTEFPKERGFIHSQCTTIRDVFTGVQEGSATYGIVPFENSTQGSVTATQDLLCNREGRFDDVSIVGETYVGVHHTLLGHRSGKPYRPGEDSPGTATPTAESPNPQKPRSRPLTDLSHVTTLYTHPMAWGQCDSFLSTYLPGRGRIDTSSTSKAAELVMADQSRSSASVSCIAAAEAFGLDVLAKRIEDRSDNTTRFLVLVRTPNPPQYGPTPILLQSDSARTSVHEREKRWKTLIRFTVDHKRPGALVEAMSLFSQHGLNLTSLNSRPSQVTNWHYIFFVEFMGKVQDSNVQETIKALKDTTEEFRLLGSFKDRSAMSTE